MKKSMHMIVRGTLAAAAFALASGSALAAGSKLTVDDFYGVPLFTATGGAFGSGNAITHTQQITCSAPSAGVTLAPNT